LLVDEYTFTLSSWIVFMWLVSDIYLVSGTMGNQSTRKRVWLDMIQYMIAYNTSARLFFLFSLYKRGPSQRRDDTRRVYSLIVPPRNF
jgi:hypothetical protein